MDGCIYRTKDGQCDLYAEGGKYKAWCEMDGCDGRKMSNADRIRAMTDEELAKYLCKLIREGVMMAFPIAHYSNADIEELNQNWLDWMRQEVDDEN